MAQPSSSSGSNNDIAAHNHMEHRIDITERLIKELEDEIKRFQDMVESRDREIQQLKGKNDALKREMEAMPMTRLTERNRILESEINAKKEELNRLNERLHIVLAKDGSSSGKITVLTAENTMLEKQRILHVHKIQEQGDMIEYRNKAIAQLTSKLTKTEGDLLRERAILELMEANYKMMEEEKTKMTENTSLLEAEFKKAKNEGVLHLERIIELSQYEEKCGQKEHELQNLRTNIFPDKERTISALNVKVTELTDALETYVTDTIPRSEHMDILHTEIERTRDTLRETFRDEYQKRVDSLEAGNTELERKLAQVEGDLHAMEDTRDELWTANDAYKRIVKENAKLSDTVEGQKRKIKNLSQELVSCKDRMARLRKTNAVM